MAGTPTISKEAQSALEEHATKHHRFETFQQDMLRLAETIWHNVRTRGDQASEDPAQDETNTETTTDESATSEESTDAPAKDETPAEPETAAAPAASPAPEARVARARNLAAQQPAQ